MSEIYGEWLCPKCKTIHRIRFNLHIDASINAFKRSYYLKNGVAIIDTAYQLKTVGRNKARRPYKGSSVYATSDTPVQTIIETVKNYMNEYYTLETNTLKVEVCL